VHVISVAVPVPFLDPLTYRVPEHFGLPAIGARVRVPVGSRTVTGCVVEHGTNGAAPDSLKDLVDVIDREPFLPPQVVELCRWVADYYLAGIGDAIGAAMPPGARTKASSFKTRRVASLTAHGLAAVQNVAPESLTAKQRAALDALAAATAALPLSDLRERGITADTMGRLAARGLVTMTAEADERDPFERAVLTGYVRDEARQLTAEQAAAFAQLGELADSGDFRVALLHGVTGSGKTENYARLAERVRQHGRQTLLMVPEIA